MSVGRRFARAATGAVVARPGLWWLFRAPMRRQFDRLAPVWDRNRTPNHLAGYEAALAVVPASPRRALDVGTGTGDGALAIARRWPETSVVGVDLAPGMLAEARRKVPPELADRVEYREADAANLPFPDASFDLVGLANMIPFFGELARVLARGGYAVFGFSAGPDTPIYVPPERLRAELERRGFADFAEVAAGRATGFVGRKPTR